MQEALVKQTLTRIGPLSAAKVIGAMYFLMGLIFLPFVAIPMIFSDSASAFGGFGFMFLAVPFIYGGVGFVMVAMAAWTYNFIAAHLGGLEIDVQSPTDPS